MNKRNINRLVRLLNDEDFRDNFKGRRLTDHLDKKYRVFVKGETDGAIIAVEKTLQKREVTTISSINGNVVVVPIEKWNELLVDANKK